MVGAKPLLTGGTERPFRCLDDDDDIYKCLFSPLTQDESRGLGSLHGTVAFAKLPRLNGNLGGHLGHLGGHSRTTYDVSTLSGLV